MLCPNCGQQEIPDRILLARDFLCPKCGADWRAFAQVLLLPRALFNDGLASAKIGDLRAAESTLRAAVHMDPELVVAWVVLGKVLARRDRLDDAIAAWKEALRLDRRNKAATRGVEWARAALNPAAKDETRETQSTPAEDPET